jgi:FRG domain
MARMLVLLTTDRASHERDFTNGCRARPMPNRSWTDIIEDLYAGSWNPALQRFRSPFAFRGLSRADHSLSSSLVRLSSGGSDTARLEMALLRNFQKYAHAESAHADSIWDWLALAQHRGLPTRLLDWTYSPLVAAHFATLGDTKCDRAIWRLDWKRVHRHFGFPELALLIADLHALVGRDGRFTPWRLIGEGDAGKPFACMIEPPTLDARISVQAGTFTLTSDTHHSFDEFLARHGLEKALSKFVIPKDHAGLVRDQLDMAGMDERRLFPDLDGVASQLRRYYS